MPHWKRGESILFSLNILLWTAVSHDLSSLTYLHHKSDNAFCLPPVGCRSNVWSAFLVPLLDFFLLRNQTLLLPVWVQGIWFHPSPCIRHVKLLSSYYLTDSGTHLFHHEPLVKSGWKTKQLIHFVSLL